VAIFDSFLEERGAILRRKFLTILFLMEDLFHNGLGNDLLGCILGVGNASEDDRHGDRSGDGSVGFRRIVGRDASVVVDRVTEGVRSFATKTVTGAGRGKITRHDVRYKGYKVY
jgi:hypothetical protein